MAIKRALKWIGIAYLLLLFLAMVVIGVGFIASGLAAQQEAERLSTARVCAPGEVVGCKLEEKVTVADLYTTSAARTGTSRWVKIQTPDGNTQHLLDHDGDLYARLSVTEQVNAQLWKGNVIELDDGAGHYLIPEDSPVVQGAENPFIGVFLIVVGGGLLAFSIRVILQRRRANRPGFGTVGRPIISRKSGRV